MEAVTGFVGRARETELIAEAVGKGSNVLVTGRAGIGKSALLRHVMRSLRGKRRVIWIPAGTTKTTLLEIARQVHAQAGLKVPASMLPPKTAARAKRHQWLDWATLERSIKRLPSASLSELVINNLRESHFLVFLESLEMPPSQATFFADILDVAQCVAAMDETNRRTRIARVLWRFHTQTELKPLPLEDCTTLVERWLAHHPVRFTDEKTRKKFIRHVARESGGNPAAIEGMLEAARALHEITPGRARAVARHDAAGNFVDLTPVLVLVLVGFFALRYISRGIGEIELLVLSGVGGAIFMGLRFFMYRMSRA